MKKHIFLLPAACSVLSITQTAAAPTPAPVDATGTIRVPAFDLPISSLLDEQDRAFFERERQQTADRKRAENDAYLACTPPRGTERPMQEIRLCQARAIYQFDAYKRVRERFPVDISLELMGGIPVEIIVPREGTADKNRKRVLINLHGSDFQTGSRYISHLESAPIASVGRIRVVSVDYRMAPEFAFPAASEDVAAVYRELLKQYEPQNIGIFGCSSGGLLTAQSIAWLRKEELPLPGAIGIFNAGATFYPQGDSYYFMSAVAGRTLDGPDRHPYFRATSANDPLAFPINSPATMSAFPPSLLISSTRDGMLSATVHTHSMLVRLGRVSDLHVWEGQGHCFFAGQNPPAADEVYAVTVRFFDKHLGKERR